MVSHDAIYFVTSEFWENKGRSLWVDKWFVSLQTVFFSCLRCFWAGKRKVQLTSQDWRWTEVFFTEQRASLRSRRIKGKGWGRRKIGKTMRSGGRGWGRSKWSGVEQDRWGSCLEPWLRTLYCGKILNSRSASSSSLTRVERGTPYIAPSVKWLTITTKEGLPAESHPMLQYTYASIEASLQSKYMDS